MTLAATGLLALASAARRGARSQVVPEAVRREAEDKSKVFRRAVAAWTRGMTIEQISGEDRMLRLREAELHDLFGERLAGIGTYRVAIFSTDPRYVIKLAMCLSDNLDEAAAWEDAGPQTRALLVPVVAHDPEGHWLIMERVEVYGGKQTPEEWGLLRQRADDLDKIGLLDLHPDNFSADFRLLDYAEPVNLKGSPARRGARSLPPAYEPTQSAPSRGTWDRTGAEPRWSQAHDVLVRDALSDWKGDTAMMVLHMQDEEAGVAMPSSGSGKIARARAAALLWEIEHKAKPAPPLFRGAREASKGWRPWTCSRRTAARWAARHGGQVYTSAEGQVGLRISDYLGEDPEREWISRLPSGSARRGAAARRPLLEGVRAVYKRGGGREGREPMAPAVVLVDGEREVGHLQVSLLMDAQGRRPDADAWAFEPFCEEDALDLRKALGGNANPVYVAWRSGIDKAYRGRGYGTQIYEWMLDSLRQEIGRDVVLVPESCLDDGKTSASAERVWDALKKRRVSLGNAVSSKKLSHAGSNP